MTAAEASRRVGQSIGLAGLVDFQEGSFDAITLWHVLEHVHTLNDTLRQLIRLLRPGGTLLIAVPNVESFDAQHYGPDWAAYDVPRHLYHFSPRTMKLLLKKHNRLLTKLTSALCVCLKKLAASNNPSGLLSSRSIYGSAFLLPEI